MKAGRELDALVAEKVMGVCPIRDYGFPIDKEERYWMYDPSGLPRYSTDIAAAWTVVEKMLSLGFYYRIQDIQSSSLHYARFSRVADSTEYERELWQESVPLTICLAALKAKGIDVG